MNNTIQNNTPKVTSKIEYLNPEKNHVFKAVASITIADAFQIHGLRVVEGKTGLFVGMPTRSVTDKTGEKRYVETCHPVSAEMRSAISESVLAEYKQAVKESEKASEAPEAESSVSPASEAEQEPSEDSEDEEDEEVPVMSMA